MPELPEVQTVVTTLRPRLVGRVIRAVTHVRADVVRPSGADLVTLLTGQVVATVERRAKRIVITLGDGNRFYIHLGMTGRLTVEPPDAPTEGHTHLILDLQDRGPGLQGGVRSMARAQLRFRDPRRFGGVFWLGTGPCDDRIGPEPLTLRPAQLSKRLASTTRAVKNALLDQALVAGLGNIYVDESLFAARIHPLTPACDLTAAEVARLNRAIKTVLRRAIRHRGSTLRDYVDAYGAAGGFQRLHRVYDRAAQPCKSCRTPIERILLGGRSTHFCPKCQPR